MRLVKLLSLSYALITCTIVQAETPHKPVHVKLEAKHDLQEKPFYIITGNANKDLADDIAKELGVEMTPATVKRFNDKEVSIQINQNIRNREIFIVQPTCTTQDGSINDHLMELILMIRAAKRASASKINVVIPYFGYARQDRKTHSRVPISASDIAMILEDAGASRIIAVDLHAGQIQGFFRDIPVDNLAGSIIFAPYVAGLKLENPVIVSPDAGGVERAKLFRDQLDKNGVQSDLAMIIKQRKEAGVVGQANLVGDVKDKDAIIIDDMCDTGGTLVKAAEELKRFGAKRVYACITHPVFSGNAVELIAGSQFDKVITTDTIPLREEVPKNLIQLSVAPMIAEVIRRVKNGDSVSVVFQPKQ